MKTIFFPTVLTVCLLLFITTLWGQVASPHNFPHARGEYRENYPYGPLPNLQNAAMGMNGFVALTTTDPNYWCINYLLDSTLAPILSWRPTNFYSYNATCAVNKDRNIWYAVQQIDTLHLTTFTPGGTILSQRKMIGFYLQDLIADTSGHVYLSYGQAGVGGFGVTRFTSSLVPDYQKWYTSVVGSFGSCQWGIDQRLYVQAPTGIFVIAADGSLLKVLNNVSEKYAAFQDHGIAKITFSMDSIKVMRLDSNMNLLWCKKFMPGNYLGVPYTISHADVLTMPGSNDIVIPASYTANTTTSCSFSSNYRKTVSLLDQNGTLLGHNPSYGNTIHMGARSTPYGDPLVVGVAGSCLTAAHVWSLDVAVHEGYLLRTACGNGASGNVSINSLPTGSASIGTSTTSNQPVALLPETMALQFTTSFSSGIRTYQCELPCLTVTPQPAGAGQIQFADDIYGFYDVQYAFGDGTFGNTPDPLHQYPGPGTYTVQVTATNGCGTVTKTATVQPCPSPSIAGPTAICGSAPVTFQEMNGLPAANLSWLVNGVPTGSGSTLTWTPPTPASYQIDLIYTAGICSDTLTHAFANNVGAPFSLGPDTTFCPDTTWQLTGPLGGGYLWSNNATTPSIAVATPGSYALQFTNTLGCISTDTILLGLAECVWPGDANHDGIADNQDLLAVGYAMANAGPNRLVASLSWYGQPASDWNTSLPNLVNGKHQDCDGDGLVTFADTIPIATNYGYTHNKAAEITTGTPLYIVSEMDSFPAGDTVFFRVYLGDGNLPATNAHGVAFGFHIDPQLVSAGTLYGRFQSSFLGNAGQLLTLTHLTPSSGDWHIGISRTDQIGQSGSGAILRIGFLPAQVYPISSTLGYIPLRLFNAVALDGNFAPISLATASDSIFVFNPSNAVAQPRGLLSWSIRHVPASGSATLELNLSETVEVRAQLTDLQGRCVQEILDRQILSGGNYAFRVETADLSAGLYFVWLQANGYSLVKKLIVKQ